MIKEIVIGFLVAIIATVFGTMLATSFLSDLAIVEALKSMYYNDLLSKVMTLGAITNFIAFFLFLKRKQEYRARGVLLATICIALSMVIINIL
ncbi:MAG: hypothetical protein COB98_06885 [Flavobacteriaceae bacterium]|nr:MAG: hypothetical protein COB98_06885 [Flavobacteriaceae bacterium]